MSIWKKKYGFVMGGLFLFIGVLSLYLACNNLSHSDALLEEVKLKDNIKIDSGMFAIMVEGDNGYEPSDTIPSGMVFNAEKSNCIDNNGQIVTDALSYENGYVNVSVGVTSYCYLYFDEIPSDVKVTVSTDGVSNTVPTSGIYKTSTSCSSGNVYYNPYYQRLEIGGFKRGTKCTLDYTSEDTSGYTLLSSIVQSNATTNENGYRYSGKTPNNYVWFNNEMWRIIGLIPTCTSASSGTCSATTNLVKIIRAESIGGLAYDAKESGYTGLWGSNTLYTLLNSYYYGKQNGTGTSYCYGYQTTAVADCDYSEIGISSESSDYYSQMIEDVYWNIGASVNSATPGTVYGTESATVTTNTAKIGLMSPSDYGYAAVVSGYSKKMSVYNTAAITGTNWLYGQGEEWTNIQYSSRANSALDVTYNGNMTNSFAYEGHAIRPVLYLDAGVYKISGSGTSSDPYMIGM